MYHFKFLQGNGLDAIVDSARVFSGDPLEVGSVLPPQDKADKPAPGDRETSLPPWQDMDESGDEFDAGIGTGDGDLVFQQMIGPFVLRNAPSWRQQ